MGRTAITMIALAALAVSAHGVPVTSAHAHRKSASVQTAHRTPVHEHSVHATTHLHEKAATLHHATKPASNRPSEHRAAEHARKPAPESAHKPTPEEVGRAAGLKIRSELDRRAAMRRAYNEHRRPRLVRTRYTPVRFAPRAETNAEENVDEQPSSQPAPKALSGTTHYEEVGAQPEGSNPAIADAERIEPATGSGTATSESPNYDRLSSESESAAPVPAAPVTAARRNAAPQPIRSSAADSDTDETDSTVADADAPADGYAVHPSFARHAEVREPEDTVGPDDRAAARETAGENDNAYNISEDKRLKAETEEASLAIARGYMPAPLYGNRASLERQNERLEAEGLERIEDENDLAERIAHHLLVPVPVSDALTINSNLPVNHRYCRPWTARFLSDLAAAHQARFHRPLEVSSAVRTVEYQKKLMQVNGNAAPAEGDIVSPHLTGATIDIAKDNLSRAEIAWMRRYLLAIEAEGKIDVEEEFQQACFHIAVYKDYMPSYHGTPRHSQTPAQAHTGGTKGRGVHTAVADGVSTQGI